MSWRRDAPPVFLRAPPLRSYQKGYLQHAAPHGSEERDVLDDYVNGGSSLWFNNYLRGRHMENLSARDKREYRKKTTTLNRLIKAAPRSTQNVVLFRAIAEDAPRFRTYRRGDDADFLNQGMISTSVSFRGAAAFLESDETCCMLVVLVPKGTRYLEVLDASAWTEEDEIILPHGSRFKVLTSSVLDGITTYYCTLVAQEG